jgi:hypothetical protein
VISKVTLPFEEAISPEEATSNTESLPADTKTLMSFSASTPEAPVMVALLPATKERSTAPACAATAPNEIALSTPATTPLETLPVSELIDPTETATPAPPET